MKSVSGKDLSKVLERNGWNLLRIKGSHHIFGKTGSVIRISIHIHGNNALKTGLVTHLLKMADLKENDLD